VAEYPEVIEMAEISNSGGNKLVLVQDVSGGS
jgi:hypothetical protein